MDKDCCSRHPHTLAGFFEHSLSPGRLCLIGIMEGTWVVRRCLCPTCSRLARAPSSWSLWLTHLSETLGSSNFRGGKQLCGVSWQCEAHVSSGEVGDRAGFVTRGTRLEVPPPCHQQWPPAESLRRPATLEHALPSLPRINTFSQLLIGGWQ